MLCHTCIAPLLLLNASVYIYLVKIHLVQVVHEILSVLYFSLISVMEILAFQQNWIRKQEVGHCDLILQQFFVILIILKSKVPIMLHTKYQPFLRKC